MATALEMMLEELRAGLARREEEGLRRRLSSPVGIDFSSNDYLGLSDHPRLREAVTRFLSGGAAGAPASRLLRGNSAQHERVEEEFARFKGAERALLFPSGYQANVGLLSSLLTPRDRVLSDARNHASLIDGMRLSGCAKVVYPHLDLESLTRQLATPHAGGRTYIVTESLFSADGDAAPLDRLADLAERHGALLIVDDAHATGVFGDQRGSGLVEARGVAEQVLAVTSTCGKALGLCGAFVTGSELVIEHVLNHARSFIYSTAPMPALAAAISESIEIVQAEPWRRARVLENAARLRRELQARGVPVRPGSGPIVPVLIGDNAAASSVSGLVRDKGYDVRALRPPTVPRGRAMLRISVHADHTDAEIEGLCDAVAASLASTGVAAS